MPKQCRTEAQIINDIFDNAYYEGECIEPSLRPSWSRGHARHYVSVGGRNGEKVRLTRLVWRYCKGPIGEGLGVLHTCDNPKCINIEHLFLGTQQDNTDDMIAKGRKIDDPEVGARRRKATAHLIKTLRDKGYTDLQITMEYGLSTSTIWNYTHGPYRESLTEAGLAVPAGDTITVCD